MSSSEERISEQGDSGVPKREEFTGSESWNVAYPGGILV